MFSEDTHIQNIVNSIFLLLSQNMREKRLIYSILSNEVIAVCEGLAPIGRTGGDVSWLDTGQMPGTQESLLFSLSFYSWAEERENINEGLMS